MRKRKKREEEFLLAVSQSVRPVLNQKTITEVGRAAALGKLDDTVTRLPNGMFDVQPMRGTITWGENGALHIVVYKVGDHIKIETADEFQAWISS